MDVWIVAVAAGAGAGYAVQNLKNLTRAKKKCLDLSSKNLSITGSSSTNVRQKVEDKRCPLKKELSRKCSREEISEEREIFCKDACGIESASIISGHENENLVVPHSTRSDSNSLGEILNNEDVEGGREGVLSSESNETFMVGSASLPSTSEVGFCFSNERNRNSSLKSRRINIQSIKPQTSLESCLMAQLYEEQCKIDEYALQKPTVRPLLVTDGSSIISRTPFKSFSEATGVGREFQKWKDVYSDENKTVHGIPRLPNLETTELQKKVKNRNREQQGFRRTHSSKIEHGYHDNAQGTSDRALLFYLGLSMGIISSIFANKQEVEKLKNLLKQTENLAQDLQEELEMKDSLTVKELATEDNESQDVLDDHCFDTVHSLSLEHNIVKENCDEKAEMKSLSNIEAELEAELQRLEFNMSSSSLKGKLCKLTELNPDLASDVPESRSDLFGANTVNLFYDGRDRSHTSTPRSAHYSVSPRELSLRLHQVIQTRLEERVKELETALENSERKIKYMESGHIHPWWDSSNYKTGTFSTQVSPVSRVVQDSVDQPVAINFEALTSDSEAYEELKKVSEPDDKVLKIGFKDEYLVENVHMDPHSTCNGNRETVIDQRMEEVDCCPSNDIEEGEDDEMERLLIMQIVEKAKQGSPAVLKAKTAFLLSNDEIQH